MARLEITTLNSGQTLVVEGEEGELVFRVKRGSHYRAIAKVDGHAAIDIRNLLNEFLDGTE